MRDEHDASRLMPTPNGRKSPLGRKLIRIFVPDETLIGPLQSYVDKIGVDVQIGWESRDVEANDLSAALTIIPLLRICRRGVSRSSWGEPIVELRVDWDHQAPELSESKSDEIGDLLVSFDRPEECERLLRSAICWACERASAKNMRALLSLVQSVHEHSIGRQYVDQLVKAVAAALNLRYAFAGQLSNQEVQSISLWVGGQRGEDFSYDLKGTPCNDVLRQGRVCKHGTEVCDLYPEDTMLRTMDVHAYVGAPMYRADGKLQGILVALDTKAREDLNDIATVFEFLAGRISAELEREAAQQRQLSLTAELEARVEERTRELTKLQAQRVEDAHRSGMAEIAAVVIHNTGNMLNHIIASATRIERQSIARPVRHLQRLSAMLKSMEPEFPALLREHPQGSQIAHFLHTISNSLNATQEVIGQEVARILRAGSEITHVIRTQQGYAVDDDLYRQIAIDRLVEDAVELARSSLAAHRIDVHLKLHAAAQCVVNPNKLIHVLNNLLSNARDAMHDTPAGRRRLLISTICQGHGKKIRISVQDDGCGLSPDELKKLFRWGFSTKETGHGLGLHSSMNYVREMGGDIEAYSEGHDRGARFVITLPTAEFSSLAAYSKRAA